MSRRRARWAASGLAGVSALATLGQVGGARAAGQVAFAAPIFVDKVRAGGEPGIIHSTKFGNLVYTAHEGTTHLDREGFASNSIVQFLCPGLTTADCYKNHVWIWTSDDHGATWQLRDEGLQYTGFSDPDLSEDASGSIYNTGIDLANDSVFSSQDGGKTWPHGNPQCHEGDRPWLAGGRAGELFMTTDADSGGGHQLFYSSNYGDTCSGSGVRDNGSIGTTSFSGFGKLVYDRFDGSVIEPAVFHHADGTVGVGISRLANAATAFSGGTQTFQPVEVAHPTSVYSPFGAPLLISMDSAENIYFAWDTDERDAGGTGGCNTVQSQPLVGGGPTPLPNHIMFAAGKHVGPGQWQFSAPISLASQGNARVLWPWSVAGSAGNVSVVWYQMDKMVDPDCDLYNGQSAPDVRTFIYEAHISNATTPATRQFSVTKASGRAIHQGGICDSGTTCVVTGQDRRLGDYFTNSVDGNGCVIIASGDTTVLDSASGGPRATSLPIFIQQTSGPGLTGKDCGSTAAAGSVAANTAAVTSLPNTATGMGRGLAPLAALAVVPLLGWYRRRRR
jgi:hypothetical protein